MRKLMWFTIGFAAACVIGAYWICGNVLFALGGSLLAAAAAGLLLFRSPGVLRKGAVLLTGIAVGFCVYQLYESVYLAPVRTMDGKTVELTICAKDFGYEASYGMAVDGTTELFGKQYQVKVYVHEEAELVPGTIIKGGFRLRFTGAGGIQEPTYHRGEGVFLLAYPDEDIAITAAQGRSWQYGPVYLREAILHRIGVLFPEDVKPFVQALLLGDTTALDYATDTALKLSGIRHVVAVSGLHVSILFAAIYWITGKRKFWTVFLGVPVLLLFAAVAGFSPSILRACTMQILMLLAMLFKREYDPPTALSFAVLLMLMSNPQTITSVGFQLSVASVAGIFLFSGKIRGWFMDPKRWGRTKGKSLLGRGLRAAAASISVSVGAMITTTPLCAWYFGTVSLIGVAVNLLCLPVVTCLFCGIIACCILGAIWIPAGAVAGWVLAWSARYILWVAKVAAGFPLAAVYTQSLYVCLWLGFCYVLLAVFMLCRQRRPLALLCCATLGLCFALLASWVEPTLDDYRVTVLDVGQGQCILLQSQ